MKKKYCLTCGNELDSNRKKYCCPECAKVGQKEKAKEWRTKNQDKIKQWRTENQDELRTYMRDYMRDYYSKEENKQKQLDRMSEYRKKKGMEENESPDNQ